MFGSVECQECHDLSQPLSIEAVGALCVDCHDDEEYEQTLTGWVKSLAVARKAAESALANLDEVLSGQTTDQARTARAWLDENRVVVRTIVESAPLHNPDGATLVFKTIAHEAQELVDSNGLRSVNPNSND